MIDSWGPKTAVSSVPTLVRICRKSPNLEDDLKNEDNLKNEDDLKNEDNLKNEDDLKNEECQIRNGIVHEVRTKQRWHKHYIISQTNYQNFPPLGGIF